MAQHAPPVLGGRVATAGEHPDAGKRDVFAQARAAQLLQRPQEIAADIVVERLQRRDVQNAAASLRVLTREELIEGPEEGGEGLAAPRRSGHQHMLSGGDARPRLGLDIGGHADAR